MLSKASKITLLSYSNQAVSMVLIFIQIKVLTYYLSVDVYGAYNQVQSTVSLLSMVLGLNLGHGFLRLASSYPLEKKTRAYHSIFITQCCIVILATLILLPFYGRILYFLVNGSSLLIYLIVMAQTMFTFMNTSTGGYLLVCGRDVDMVRQNLYIAIFNPLCVILSVTLFPNLYGVLSGFLLSLILDFAYLNIRNSVPYRNIGYDFSIIKEILNFSLPLISVSIAYWVISTSSSYFINYFRGLDEVGRFAVSFRLPMMLVTIFTLLSTVFLTNVSRLFDSKQFERVSFWFSFMIRFFIYLGVAGGAFLVASDKSVTLLVSTPEYLFEELDLFYLLVCIGSIMFGVFQIVTKLYDVEKKVKVSGMVWAITMIASVILNLILIPALGLVGAALSSASTFAVGLLLIYRLRPRTIDLRIPWMKIVVYAFFSFGIAYFLTSMQNENPNMVIGFINGILIVIVSLIFGFLLKLIRVDEVKSAFFNQ